jgi:DNA replication and repair protein RecF
MRLTRLRLRSVRAYDAAEIEPPDGLAVLFGANGEGKTTILEAIATLATLRSFRTPRLSNLLKSGSEEGRITGGFSEPDQERTIELRPGGRTLKHNDKAVRRASAFIDGFRVVALAPEHLEILGGGAEDRRRFLDRLEFSLDPLFLDISQRYHRALHQKQALLRSHLPFSTFSDEVAPWNQELVAYAREIRRRRRVLVETLRPLVTLETGILAPEGGAVDLKYQEPDSPMEDELAAKSAAEHRTARTLSGPHRDDLKISLRGEEAGRVASQGERASILLGLKLAELSLIERQTEETPTLLLDDLGATLDAARRARLLSHLSDRSRRGLLTTADDGVLRAATEAGARAFRKKTEPKKGGFSIARWVPA